MAKLEKIIEYWAYLFLFLLPWQTRFFLREGSVNGGFSEYAAISLYLSDILALVLLALAGFNFFSAEKRETVKPGRLWLLLAGLEIFIFISVFFAPDKVLAVFSYLRFLLALGIFWALKAAALDRTKLFVSFLAGAAVQAGLGVWQFLNQGTFASKWLGLAYHSSAEPGTSVIEFMSGGRWLRAYGGLDHPNMFGGFLAIALLMAVILYFKKDGLFQAPNKFYSAFKIFVFYAAVFAVFSGLIMSFSRSAWIGAIIGTLFLFFSRARQGDYSLFKKGWLFFSSLAVLFFIIFFAYGDLFRTRVYGGERLEKKSAQERIASYSYARGIVKDNFFLGAGVGNYVLALEENVSGEKSYFYQPVHNALLLLWAESGIFSLLFLFSIFYFLFSVLRHNDASALLTAVFAMMFFDHWWWSLHFGVFFLWISLGLALKWYNNDNNEKYAKNKNS